MRNLFAYALLACALTAAPGAAFAQKGLSTGPNLDSIDNARRIEEDRRRALEVPRKEGLAALQAGDYALAEQKFGQLLSFDPTTTDANYLMGLAQLGLDKWSDAKQHLEIAVKDEPKRPEPKARLGVAHVMLGDINSAADQHDALSAMWQGCNKCDDAQTIGESLMMLDKVLVAATKPKAS